MTQTRFNELAMLVALMVMNGCLLLACHQRDKCQQHCRELEAQIARDKEDWKNLFVSPKTP